MVAVPSGCVAVTGASGLIGTHIVRVLLEKGYVVRAVVRNKDNAEKTAHLVKLAEGQPGKLELFSGDLSIPNSYDDAFNGADAVVHTAAVVEVMDSKDPQKDIVDPSVKGTENVLASVAKSGTIKRFVQTSSVAAVQSFDKPEDHVFTEEDWNTWSTVANGDAYGFAKAQAERLVWEDAKGKAWDAVAINPTVVFGECYTKAHTKASTVLLRQVIYGNTTVNFNITTVAARDVALAHYEALCKPEAAGQRFLLVGNEPPMNTQDLAGIAQKEFPQYIMSTAPMYPAWKWALVKTLGALPIIGGYVLSDFQRNMMERTVRFSNEKAKEVLGINFMPLEEQVRVTISSMIDNGFVKPRPRTAAQ